MFCFFSATEALWEKQYHFTFSLHCFYLIITNILFTFYPNVNIMLFLFLLYSKCQSTKLLDYKLGTDQRPSAYDCYLTIAPVS